MVTRQEFEWTRNAIGWCLAPAAADNLTELLYDAEIGLQYSHFLRRVRLSATNEPTRQIVVRCRPLAVTFSSAEIIDELERFWREDLRSERTHDLAMYVIERNADQVLLEGVTTFKRAGFYVTYQVSVELGCPRRQLPPA